MCHGYTMTKAPSLSFHATVKIKFHPGSKFSVWLLMIVYLLSKSSNPLRRAVIRLASNDILTFQLLHLNSATSLWNSYLGPVRHLLALSFTSPAPLPQFSLLFKHPCSDFLPSFPRVMEGAVIKKRARNPSFKLTNAVNVAEPATALLRCRRSLPQLSPSSHQRHK